MSDHAPTTGPSAATCCAPAAGRNPALAPERIAAVAKALSEPVRVEILDVVRRSAEPVCQCELVALFDMKQSLVAHHIRKLVDAGLLAVERRHRWAFYSPAEEPLEELISWLN